MATHQTEKRIQGLAELFFQLSDDEQLIAQCLYRLLAKGRPVELAMLLRQTGLRRKPGNKTRRAVSSPISRILSRQTVTKSILNIKSLCLPVKDPATGVRQAMNIETQALFSAYDPLD